jgi:CBS domain-containing protein
VIDEEGTMATTTKTKQTIRDVMTTDPLVLERSSTVADAARAMKGADVGPVPVVRDDGTLCGIVTDRDIVMRVVAEDRDPASTKVGDIASAELHTLAPDDTVDDAVKLMRQHAIRRLPIIEGDKPVGIVALGDLAQEQDPKSALADISAAPPNG